MRHIKQSLSEIEINESPNKHTLNYGNVSKGITAYTSCLFRNATNKYRLCLVSVHVREVYRCSPLTCQRK